MAASGFLFGDTFDYYVTADITRKWTSHVQSGFSSATTTIAAGAARNGASGLRFGISAISLYNGQRTVDRTLSPGDPTTCVFRTGFQYSAAQSFGKSLGILSIKDAGTIQVQIVLNVDGTLSATTGGQYGSGGLVNGTLLGTSSAALLAGNYYHLKGKVVISNSVGTVDLWLNGISILSLSSKDTQATANTSWNGFSVGWQYTGTAGSSFGISAVNLDYDDVTVEDVDTYASNYDLTGVALHAQAGNGAKTDFTCSTGSDHGALVDETTSNDDTDYNSSSNTGDIDTYTLDDLATGAVPVLVQGVDVCRKTDSGDRTIGNVFRIGGVNYIGANIAPLETYSHLLTQYLVSPATSAQFTRVEVNGMEAGIKITGP
jgi:hypothetical protein